MLASRRGRRVWILSLISAVEPPSLSFIHPLYADSIEGRLCLCRIGWTFANVTHTRRHRITPFWSTMRCGDPLFSRQAYLYDSRPLCTKFATRLYQGTVRWAHGWHLSFSSQQDYLTFDTLTVLVPRIDSILNTHSKQREWSCF